MQSLISDQWQPRSYFAAFCHNISVTDRQTDDSSCHKLDRYLSTVG